MSAQSITDYPDAPDIESSTLDYASRFAGEVGQWLLSQQINATRRAIQQHWPDRTGLSVLDVGGGHGQNIELVNELGHRLTIFSSESATTEVIDERLADGKVAIEFGSLLHLPYADNSFDLVICYRILSHMASWPELVAELSRVSRELVLVDYPSMRSVNFISNALFAVKKQIEKNTRRYGVFHDREIDAQFRQQGFARNFRYRQFFFPMALYRAIGRVGICRTLSRCFRSLGLTGIFGSPVISSYVRQ